MDGQIQVYESYLDRLKRREREGLAWRVFKWSAIALVALFFTLNFILGPRQFADRVDQMIKGFGDNGTMCRVRARSVVMQRALDGSVRRARWKVEWFSPRSIGELHVMFYDYGPTRRTRPVAVVPTQRQWLGHPYVARVYVDCTSEKVTVLDFESERVLGEFDVNPSPTENPARFKMIDVDDQMDMDLHSASGPICEFALPGEKRTQCVAFAGD